MMYEFPHPDRVVVGALGPAGERRFIIQVRQGSRMVAVEIRRDAVLSIARRIESLLREAMALGWLGEPPQTDPELGPLDAPVDVLFTVGAGGPCSWSFTQGIRSLGPREPMLSSRSGSIHPWPGSSRPGRA